MKTISAAQQQALEDLSAEGRLRQLPVQTAEKDIHVTDVLGKLSELEFRHSFFRGAAHELVEDGIRLIFAGGTSLSKAHGLINRMSEDIDLKVILAPPSAELKPDIANRARLGVVHQAIAGALNELDLPLAKETTT